MKKSMMVCMAAWLLVATPGAQAQNNNWARQQQLDQQRQQQAMARQQQLEQQRQQQREQMRQQQMQQMRQQQDQAREQMRQQQVQQMRQQQESMRQQQQANMREMTRQQQANVTKAQLEQQRRQIDEARKAQRDGRPAPAGVSPANANKAADRMTFSNGVAKLTRPLTPAEIKRGYTGKLTADGRALVQFQGRVFAVPAARVWIKPQSATKEAAPATRWSAEKQASISSQMQKLAAGGRGGKPPGGPGGMVRTAANDNSLAANRVAFAKYFSQSGKDETDIFRHARGWDYSKPIHVTKLKAGTELCQWQIPGKGNGSYFAPCGSSPSALGISDRGSDRSRKSEILNKVEKKFVLTRDTEFLQGTAAAVVDDWSVHDQRVETQGGGRQYLLKNNDSDGIREIP